MSLFVPAITGSYNSNIVWNMSAFVIPDSYIDYLESVQFTHRPKYISKKTGFETVRYQINANTGSDFLIDIDITFVGDLPREVLWYFMQLARGCAGAGLHIVFYDNLWSAYAYTARWVNAGDFIENTELLNGGSMTLESWSRSAIV